MFRGAGCADTIECAEAALLSTQQLLLSTHLLLCADLEVLQVCADSVIHEGVHVS